MRFIFILVLIGIIISSLLSYVDAQAIPSPLKQLKSGVSLSDIQCNPSYVLIVKESNGNPAYTQEWNTNIPSAITGASSSTTVSSPSSVTCKWTASNSGDLWDDVAIEVKVAG